VIDGATDRKTVGHIATAYTALSTVKHYDGNVISPGTLDPVDFVSHIDETSC